MSFQLTCYKSISLYLRAARTARQEALSRVRRLSPDITVGHVQRRDIPKPKKPAKTQAPTINIRSNKKISNPRGRTCRICLNRFKKLVLYRCCKNKRVCHTCFQRLKAQNCPFCRSKQQ